MSEARPVIDSSVHREGVYDWRPTRTARFRKWTSSNAGEAAWALDPARKINHRFRPTNHCNGKALDHSLSTGRKKEKILSTINDLKSFSALGSGQPRIVTACAGRCTVHGRYYFLAKILRYLYTPHLSWNWKILQQENVVQEHATQEEYHSRAI